MNYEGTFKSNQLDHVYGTATFSSKGVGTITYSGSYMLNKTFKLKFSRLLEGDNYIFNSTNLGQSFTITVSSDFESVPKGVAIKAFYKSERPNDEGELTFYLC
jgi:hypothetical protein